MDSRKRVGPEAAFNPNSGGKKSKQALESSLTGEGSNMESLTPVTKFASTAVAQMIKLGPNRATMYVASPPPIPDVSYQPALKTRLCSDYNLARGCKFGDKCHFAHGICEFGKPFSLCSDYNLGRGCKFGDKCHFAHGICEFGKPFSLTFYGNGNAQASGHFAGSMRLPYSRRPLDIRNDPLTAQISVDASLAGAIIGNDDWKTILIRLKVKLFIREHKSDPNLKIIELHGKFQQLRAASSLVIQQIEDFPPTKWNCKGKGQ